MDNDDLEYLLKIEAEAVDLTNGAHADAEKRIIEAEKKNRIQYEETYHKEVEKLEAELNRLKKNFKKQYQKKLENYREKISAVNVDTEKFSALLNDLIAGDE